MNKDFDVSVLLHLAEKNRYAKTVAICKTIDFLGHVEFPKRMIPRKPSVKAVFALENQKLQWDYISDEAREELNQKLASVSSSPQSPLDAVFSRGPISSKIDDPLPSELKSPALSEE